MVIEAKKWLNENEWPDNSIDSDAFSHHTKMSTIMEQYAREYHAKKCRRSSKKRSNTI